LNVFPVDFSFTLKREHDMPCKLLITTGMLLFVSTFLACSSSSGKKDQKAPAAPNQPVNPDQNPTPGSSATPEPTTGTGQSIPSDMILGDWQSAFSDPHHFGNITYSIKSDGRVLLSLLIYRKGESRIMTERHEFKGTFHNNPQKIDLVHVKGSCAPKSSAVTLTFSRNSDVLSLREGADVNYPLRLNKLKGGLSQDVHSFQALSNFPVQEGCFIEGRLNQFVPQVRG
jgi:hypothetical protein